MNIDTFSRTLKVLLLILLGMFIQSIVACTSETVPTAATEQPKAVEEKTPEIANTVLNPPQNVPEPDFVEGDSVHVPGVKPKGRPWKDSAIQTFKYKGYCYMAFINGHSGVGLTQIHCDGM